MVPLYLIPDIEFFRIHESDLPVYKKLKIIADMCRANALTSVKIAGSGHLGSSFSAMDIVVFLYYHWMNTVGAGFDHPDRDIYFSSKGHDVPGLYSVLYSLKILSKEKLLKLRRLGGLDGHPDVRIGGIECNSGSLGMGISKAKGMALAKKLAGHEGKVFVLTGDGELQEGQIFEALQTTVHQKINNLTVIVDHNKVQSDKKVNEILDLGDLELKFTTFGWYVERCNGHDFSAMEKVMKKFDQISDRPKILIADTIKGKGVSFMEHPIAMKDAGGLYRWHAGAPDDQSFLKGYNEIVKRVNNGLAAKNMDKLNLEEIHVDEKIKSSVSKEYVADAFGKALVELGQERNDFVVLDADLAADCRTREFEENFPERFIENGIAEQDMVSMAGGIALQGYLPVVNSFAAFLASRANEQIYTNACEGTKIVYVCHYAGLIPAGPGKSHQSIRDISLFGALPGFEIIQPCNGDETRLALKYCINDTKKSCVLRLVIGPSPRIIQLPVDYHFESGKGVVLKDGNDAVLFGYGPVMLNEALVASKLLNEKNFSLKVVNMPWLNKINIGWLTDIIENCNNIFIMEDHAATGGLYDFFLKALSEKRSLMKKHVFPFGVNGFPECGTPGEVLRYHGLDGKSLADKIYAICNE